MKLSIRRLTLCILAGAAFAATALCAQLAPSIGRASFYTERDFRGEYLVVEAPNTIENLVFVRDPRGRPFNDRFRSVRLEGPVRVALFEHS